MTDAPVAASVARETGAPPRSQWWDVWDQFRSHKGAMIGLFFFAFALLFVFLGPLIWTIEPTYIDVRARNTGPSWAPPRSSRSRSMRWH